MSTPFRASLNRTRSAVQSQLARALECFFLVLMVVLGATQAYGGGPVIQGPDEVAAHKAGERRASDRVLVRFKKDAPAAQREVALGHARALERKHFARSGVSVLQLADEKQSVEDAIHALEASGAVEYAVPDQILFALDTVPNDSFFGYLDGLHNTGQMGGTPDADIDAPAAWDVTTGDASIVVGVIDTGVDYTHPDLAGNMWQNPGETVNGLDDDGNGYVDDVFGIDCVNDDGDPFDDHYHGTHVAGTIGARGNDGLGVSGVSWNVGLMALKFLSAGGWGYTSDAIECLDYATRMRTEYGVNVRLTSNSWGGGAFDQALYDAIQASGEAGMLFVAAAGNSASDNDGAFPSYPSSYDLPNVVAVAATDRHDQLAWFSSYGRSSVDLGAPGVDTLSTMPGSSYTWLSGTSMATPHVSGAAALVWAAFPDLGPLEMKQLLMDAGDPNPALAGRTVSGNRLNVANAIHCDSQISVGSSLADGFRAKLGERVPVEVRLRDCGAPVVGANVGVTAPEGALTARDNGAGLDTAAGDGIYTAAWRPRTAGAAMLVVDAQIGAQPVGRSFSGEVFEDFAYEARSTRFRWIDTAGGVDTGLASDDASLEIPIGFAFPFYGESHETVKVSTNGYLTFGEYGWVYRNQPIPSADEPNGIIAPYWDDLLPARGGRIRYLLEGQAPKRQLTVEWNQVPYYGDTTSTATFEVTLHEDGQIEFRYQDVQRGTHGGGVSATVGVENLEGDLGLQLSHDQAQVADGTAIKLRSRERR